MEPEPFDTSQRDGDGSAALGSRSIESEPEYRSSPNVGVLLINLGSPDAPTASALRNFLREFLTDPRVIETPRWQWWPILNLIILPFRPHQSAARYRKIWRDDGPPLIHYTRKLRESLIQPLSQAVAMPLHVTIGMRYGSPSIRQALCALREQGCEKLLVLPMFPQYSGTTVGSVFDAVSAELSTWRVVPELRMIHGYSDDPGYVEAVAASIREAWDANGKADKLLFSFHGIPQRYVTAGDPYPGECHATARLVAERLGLSAERYDVSFQSSFGKEAWLEPSTETAIRSTAKAGVESLDVICPGFSTDCLETLEEIGESSRRTFLENGGRRFNYVACLNDDTGHVQMLTDLLSRNLEGWRH